MAMRPPPPEPDALPAVTVPPLALRVPLPDSAAESIQIEPPEPLESTFVWGPPLAVTVPLILTVPFGAESLTAPPPAPEPTAKLELKAEPPEPRSVGSLTLPYVEPTAPVRPKPPLPP